ncbi:hypothetical protein [Parvularcula dongshanensis]|uniref:Uncharacterized protein n=1 Tax=Parvularcula dongshanensis TaxID=1173995 RepID=A0A840I0G7_9PROT|nr:hypothetical protein [Parvularcula dongshanensis]MBB4657835.1 hypothetical protein [Parvularcula dongshanensis]
MGAGAWRTASIPLASASAGLVIAPWQNGGSAVLMVSADFVLAGSLSYAIVARPTEEAKRGSLDLVFGDMSDPGRRTMIYAVPHVFALILLSKGEAGEEVLIAACATYVAALGLPKPGFLVDHVGFATMIYASCYLVCLPRRRPRPAGAAS